MRRSREEVFHIILGETTKTASTSFIKIIKKIWYVQSGTYIKKSLKSIKMKLWAFISSIKFLLPGKCKELGYF